MNSFVVHNLGSTKVMHEAQPEAGPNTAHRREWNNGFLHNVINKSAPIQNRHILKDSRLYPMVRVISISFFNSYVISLTAFSKSFSKLPIICLYMYILFPWYSFQNKFPMVPSTQCSDITGSPQRGHLLGESLILIQYHWSRYKVFHNYTWFNPVQYHWILIKKDPPPPI